MKRNALTIMHGSLLILLDYDTSLTNCYQNKPIWGNIFVPDSVSAMAMDTLKGYIVYAKSLDECVSIRKAQYTADGSLDKIFAMYNEFKNDFEFINSSLNFHVCYYAAFLASIKSSFITLRFIAGSGLIPDTHIILW